MISRIGRFSIYLTLFALAFAPVFAQSPPEPVREQLLNGLTILFWQRASDANVILKLRIRSGAAFDLAGKGGTMALLADALFPDPSTREYVSDQLGGKLEVATNFDAIDIAISGKSSEFERLVELLHNAVVTPQLTPENVAKAREARIKQLAETRTVGAEADETISERLFGKFPYGHPPRGNLESVGKIERADLLLARERFLNADNATLVVIGGVEKSRVMRTLRQLLGPWRKSEGVVPATFRAPEPPDNRVLLVDQPNANAEIRLAVRGLARSDRDAAAALLLALIVRDRWQKSSADLSSVFVRHEAHTLPGMFVMGASAPSASAAKGIANALEVMRALTQAAPTTAEVEGARTALLAELTKRVASAETIADLWLDAEVYKLPSFNSQLTSITTLNATDIQRVAARLFKPASSVAIVFGDSDKLLPNFQGNVEVRKRRAPPALRANQARRRRNPD